MSFTALELEEALLPHQDIAGGNCRLVLASHGPRVLEQNGALYVVLQLIVYDDSG